MLLFHQIPWLSYGVEDCMDTTMNKKSHKSLRALPASSAEKETIQGLLIPILSVCHSVLTHCGLVTPYCEKNRAKIGSANGLLPSLLNQWRLLISALLWHSPGSNCTGNATLSILAVTRLWSSVLWSFWNLPEVSVVTLYWCLTIKRVNAYRVKVHCGYIDIAWGGNTQAIPWWTALYLYLSADRCFNNIYIRPEWHITGLGPLSKAVGVCV